MLIFIPIKLRSHDDHSHPFPLPLGEPVRALALTYESVTCAGAVDEPNLGSALPSARPQHQ